ncbi:MAG: sigma-70 family RNA polymerase sigma factor [Candidatus Omnitrophota bacterium]
MNKETELFLRLEKGDESARAEIVQVCQRLVAKVARNYVRKSKFSVSELMAEGYVGLLQAIEKFNRKKAAKEKVKFSSYAYWWIRRYVIRAVTQGQSLLAVPENTSELMSQYSHFSDIITQELGREPTDAEVQKGLALTNGQMKRFVRRRDLKEVSFDSTVSRDKENRTLSEVIGDESKEGTSRIQKVVKRLEDEGILEKLFSVLTPLEKEAITLKFGLENQIPLSYQKVGKKLSRSLSRQRVHQIVTIALQKLKKKNKGKTSFLEA